MDALVTDPIAQWLAGIFGALAGEIVKAAAKEGKEAFAKWLDGARGEEVKALRTALALALNDLEHYELQGESFVAFLEQRQKENDTLLGDALLRALLIEPHGVLSLTPNLQTRIPLALQPLALKFLSLFHQKLWSQSPFDKLLAAKAAQDELRVALETLEILRRIEKKIDQTGGGVNLSNNAHLEVEGDFIAHDQIIQGHKINVEPGGHLTIGEAPSPIKPEELAAAQRAYLEFVIGANQDVKPPSVIDAQNSVTLQLDEIYFPVTITFKEIRAETDKKDKRDKSQEEPPKRIELAQIVRDNSRAVLLGEPGAGKTTILRYLALHFAKTLREHPDYSVNVRDRDTDFGVARLPILIRLATFASAKRTLREYILDAFSDVSAPKEAVEQVLTEAMSQGKALILLDGLDEVLDNRAYVIEQIESFDAGLQGHNQIIVTSRRSSYGRALGGAFKAFDLNELEQEQIAKFLVYWNLAIEKKRIQENGETFQTEQEYEQAVKERAQEQFPKIAEKLDTNLGAQSLAKNPLTLRMLAEAYRWSGDLPNRRVDLYNLIVKQSLEFWETDVAHVPEGRTVTFDEAIDLLGPLAYWMHSEKESPSETEIKSQLKRALKANPDRIVPTESIAKTIENFWTRAKERTGLFVQDTPNHYRFVHATFREYFAGLHLVKDHENAAQRIYAHRHQPRWEEPILLALGSVSDATELIRTAILANSPEANEKNFKSSDYDDVLHRDFFFAARCVADGANIDDTLAKEFAEQLVEWWFSENAWKFSRQQILDWRFFGDLSDAVRYLFDSVQGTKLGKRIGEIFLSILDEMNTTAFEAELEERINALRSDWGALHVLLPPKFYGAYVALKFLGQDCSLQVVKVLLRLWRTENRYARQEAEGILESLQKREGIAPILADIVEGKIEEIKLFAAILLAEVGQTTPKAIRCLFDILADDGKDEETHSEQDEPDYETRSNREYQKQRKKETRERAFNALLYVERTAQVEQIPAVIAFLLSVVVDADKQIEMIATLQTGKELYKFLITTYPPDIRKQIAAFLLVRLGRVDALNILQTAILKPESGQLFLATLQRFVPLELLDKADLQAVMRDATLGSSDLFSITRERYAAVFAAKRLAELQEVSDEIINRALELSVHIDRTVQRFAVELLQALRCRQPAVYSRLMMLLADKGHPDEENKYYREQLREETARVLYNFDNIPEEFLPRILDTIKEGNHRLNYYVVPILADFKINMPAPTHREIAATLFPLLQTLPQDSDLREKVKSVLGYLALTPDVMQLMLDIARSEVGPIKPWNDGEEFVEFDDR